MNDYAIVTDAGMRLTPAMTVARHKTNVAFLNATGSPGPKWSYASSAVRCFQPQPAHRGNGLDGGIRFMTCTN